MLNLLQGSLQTLDYSKYKEHYQYVTRISLPEVNLNHFG